MYYLKYNGVDLTSIANVKEVDIPALPSMSHSEISIFERDGGLYNGMSYGTRNITLKMIIKADNADDYDTFVRDVKRAFYTKEEAALYCGDENLYILCAPVDDMTITELGNNCAEAEVNLVSYDPYWYFNEEVLTNADEGSKEVTVTNKGDTDTYPIIDIVVGGNTTFIQVENKATQGKILLGKYPVYGQITEESNPVVIDDTCQTTAGWTSSTISIEQDTANGGTIGIADSGESIKCADFGNSSGSTWHGACYRKNLDSPVTDFKVRAKMRHNSTGENGDPTIEKPYENDTSQVLKGQKTYFYQVTKSGGLPVRKSPEKKAKSWGTIKKGTKITDYTVQNGWIKFKFKTKTGYLQTGKANGLTKTAKTNQVTETRKNMVTAQSTAIRVSASGSALNKKTIPAGECIRVIYSPKYPTSGNNKGKFYKLAKPYKGKTGFVKVDNLVEASDYTIEYEEMYELADDKTGKIILGGYSSDGTQLFSLSLIDDNEYYEFTYPKILKNGKEFLVDKKVAPTPKIGTEYKESGGELTAIKKYELSGQYGSWNFFEGFLYIERVQNKWYAYVTKDVNGKSKKIEAGPVTDTANREKALAFVLLYIGTTGGQEKSCSMSLCDLEVVRASKEVTTDDKNWQEFKVGDVVRIDNNIPAVYVNGIERPGIIDVGSDFFKLEPGENRIVLTTDDNDPSISVTHTEKFL